MTRKPLFSTDKSYQVIPKVLNHKSIFIWNCQVLYYDDDDDEIIIKYCVHEDGVETYMTEEELLQKYYFVERK